MDWATVSSLATAGGTLVLAVATFASVRSSNRSARVAEASLLANLRPLLVPSRREDPELKVGFADNHFVRVAGGFGTAELGDDAIYLTMSVRNAGSGIAVLHGWRVEPGGHEAARGQADAPAVDSFRRLSRDLYIPPSDIGFWQGAVRDRSEPEWDLLVRQVKNRERIVIDVLYGDQFGGQRVISRFSLLPVETGDQWLTGVARHWNVDRPDPR